MNRPNTPQTAQTGIIQSGAVNQGARRGVQQPGVAAQQAGAAQIIIPAGASVVVLNLADSVTPTDALLWVAVDLKADSVTPVDAVSKVAVELKADSVTPADAITKVAVEGKADAVTAVDQLVVHEFETLTIADAVTASDQAAKTAVTSKSDAAAATDSVLKTIVKAIAEALGATDATTKTAGKTIADSAGASDTMVGHDTMVLGDSAVASDAITTTLFQSLPLVDNVVATDDVQFTETVVQLGGGYGAHLPIGSGFKRKFHPRRANQHPKVMTLELADSVKAVDRVELRFEQALFVSDIVDAPVAPDLQSEVVELLTAMVI